jgi:hypothetical protein
MTRPSDVQAKLDRQRDFWLHQNRGGPLIGFTGSYFSYDTVRMLKRREGQITPDDIDVERFLEDCDAQYMAWRQYTGDLFWTASPLWGFRWLNAALGQPLHVNDDNVWSAPAMDDYHDLGRLHVTADNPWMQALLALSARLATQAAGRYPLGAKPFMGPLSLLAELRGNTALAFDLYDRPGEVQAALEILTESWVRLTSLQFDCLPAWHGGTASAVRYVWAPGRIIEFDEDPAFMFSPRFHTQFVMSSHRRLTNALDYPYIHLHSTQLHTLEHLLDLETLPAIEVTPDLGASIPDLIPALQRIQARKPLIVHGVLTAAELRMIAERVPSEGLCVIGRADTPQEAARLAEQLWG